MLFCETTLALHKCVISKHLTNDTLDCPLWRITQSSNPQLWLFLTPFLFVWNITPMSVHLLAQAEFSRLGIWPLLNLSGSHWQAPLPWGFSLWNEGVLSPLCCHNNSSDRRDKLKRKLTYILTPTSVSAFASLRQTFRGPSFFRVQALWGSYSSRLFLLYCFLKYVQGKVLCLQTGFIEEHLG